MKYKLFILILILTASIAIYLHYFSIYGNAFRKTSINGVEFRTEIVSSPEKRALGLGGRKSLCSNCAMLFVFPQTGIYDFWMKDMNFNLDIIWIRGDQITNIAKNVFRSNIDFIVPDTVSDKVLEINPGLSDKYRFKVGDRIEIR